ncbi:hypothetical protein MBOU_19340 [Mycobacterium bourgelatii]|uniref:Uncharacterized protein n=1 Tax=Mycobacterium bourgelatii TaxID=1273442 RepID=A0A7I9YMV2_MYCBU|nr:hypothetical protein MBOU_19340 [Mycobacterium bourgelatii]
MWPYSHGARVTDGGFEFGPGRDILAGQWHARHSTTRCPSGAEGLDCRSLGYGQRMKQDPKDATQVTEEQRRMQEELDHQGEDPDAPALHQSRHDVADETRR